MWAIRYPAVFPLMGMIPGLEGLSAGVWWNREYSGSYDRRLSYRLVRNHACSVLFHSGRLSRCVRLYYFAVHSPRKADRDYRRGNKGKGVAMKHKPINFYPSFGTLVLIFVIFFFAQNALDAYKLRILNLCAIYTILAVSSMNLINGFTGQFSLGHAGFMVGAYVTAILTLSPEQKQVILLSRSDRF